VRSQILPPRERDVRLLATGLPNKQIAGEPGLTEGPSKQHHSRAMRKLGIS
jgi:DNA-binding NarL/FixJ family response regulator